MKHEDDPVPEFGKEFEWRKIRESEYIIVNYEFALKALTTVDNNDMIVELQYAPGFSAPFFEEDGRGEGGGQSAWKC